MSGIYLILGGARSGKSSYGEKLAASFNSKVGYFATSKITDAEMEKRITLHRQRRPSDWLTFELGKTKPDRHEIDRILMELGKNGINTLLVDCATNLLFRLLDNSRLDKLDIISNEMEKKIETEVLGFFSYFIERLVIQKINVIIISNEIGMGVVPAFPLGRVFRDLMGMVNKDIATAADRVYLFTAGLKQRLK